MICAKGFGKRIKAVSTKEWNRFVSSLSFHSKPGHQCVWCANVCVYVCVEGRGGGGHVCVCVCVC